MKRIVLVVALTATLGLQAAEAQPRHRHHQKTEQVTPAAQPSQASDADVVPDGQVAFSDTSSVSVDSAATGPDTYDADSAADLLSFKHYDNPFSFYVALFSAGFGGILLALTLLLFFCIIFIGPLVLLYMLIRYFMNRHDEKVRLRQAALAGGKMKYNPQSLDERQHPYNAYMWSNGVRNTSLGLGMVLMFYIWGADALTGVGALVMCLGLGQMLIAWTQRRVQDGTPDDAMMADDVADNVQHNPADTADREAKADASAATPGAEAQPRTADKNVDE